MRGRAGHGSFFLRLATGNAVYSAMEKHKGLGKK